MPTFSGYPKKPSSAPPAGGFPTAVSPAGHFGKKKLYIAHYYPSIMSIGPEGARGKNLWRPMGAGFGGNTGTTSTLETEYYYPTDLDKVFVMKDRNVSFHLNVIAQDWSLIKGKWKKGPKSYNQAKHTFTVKFRFN